ncbi:uncharacterized protein si:dkeyp-55f12.3 [Hemiscyllium ocellatum]|uniref:uncharacterized protein si:dkeyp-55f12.3 n=1 Tax=Hemiscyllium ocellatum TaxID=170820 RepID=UPI0029668FAE|nr:uncharacterized protein si:dkeyp-55f12.3 [Hemiscyllium ocellatum]XP_060685341.1 uncharacterized protein si:dkeyp-55f12.3 [Hemiscyllium ocellatum]
MCTPAPECELCGELCPRSGERRRFAVRTACTVPGVLSGVRLLQQQLQVALSELVLQEKGQQQGQSCPESPASSTADEDEDDSEDESADKGDGDAPPSKRTRKQC